MSELLGGKAAVTGNTDNRKGQWCERSMRGVCGRESGSVGVRRRMRGSMRERERGEYEREYEKEHEKEYEREREGV